MRKKEGFIITYIGGTPYLLPFGQKIAEKQRGIRLNDTGVFLLRAISDGGDTRESLLNELVQKYGTTTDPITLEQDMNSFLDELLIRGFIEESCALPPVLSTLCIGGLTMELRGEISDLPEQSNLSAFAAPKNSVPDLTVTLHRITAPDGIPEGGILLIHTPELVVCEHDNSYLLILPQMKQIHHIILKKKEALAQIYYIPFISESLAPAIFHALRFIFLYFAQQREQFVIHSSSLLYRDKLWLFSGASGSGKSTHTNIWNRLYQTPIINGDLNLLAIEKGEAVVHGIPWCGTSGIFDTGTYPLGGIIHLRKAKENLCLLLPGTDKILRTMQRFISPAWNQELFQKNISFSEAICQKIPVFELSCTPTDDAAIRMKQVIDRLETN